MKHGQPFFCCWEGCQRFHKKTKQKDTHEIYIHSRCLVLCYDFLLVVDIFSRLKGTSVETAKYIKICHVSHFASRIQGWSPANRWPNDPAAGGGFNVSGLMVWYECQKHTDAGIVTGSYLFRLKRKGNTPRGRGMKETSQWDLNLHGFWYLRNDLYKQKRYLQLLMSIPIFTTMTPQANKFSWKMSISL